MKINAAFLKSLLLATPIIFTLPAVAKPQGKTAPAPAASEEAKAEGEEAEPTIPGLSVPRKSGNGYIGVTIEGSGFKLAFYDAKKKPVPCDVARATARWRPHYKTTEEFKTLTPSGDGMTLVSSDVRPPYNFKLFLTLLSEDGQALESYSLDFHE